MFFIKEPNADDNYQASGPEGYRESQLPFRGQERISNNGKCNLVITPAHIPYESLIPHSLPYSVLLYP